MTTLKQILADYAPEYIQRFADAMPFNHRKTLEAVVHCRTDFFGATVYRCENCGKNHLVYRCCGNRYCPSCQNHKTRKWLEPPLCQDRAPEFLQAFFSPIFRQHSSVPIFIGFFESYEPGY